MSAREREFVDSDKIHSLTSVCTCVERQLAGAVHVGAVQGAVTHAVYRVRSVPTSEHHGRLADHCQYADWCHLLRAVCRTHDHGHSVIRHVQTTLPREGPLAENIICNMRVCMSKCNVPQTRQTDIQTDRQTDSVALLLSIYTKELKYIHRTVT